MCVSQTLLLQGWATMRWFWRGVLLEHGRMAVQAAGTHLLQVRQGDVEHAALQTVGGDLQGTSSSRSASTAAAGDCCGRRGPAKACRPRLLRLTCSYDAAAHLGALSPGDQRLADVADGEHGWGLHIIPVLLAEGVHPAGSMPNTPLSTVVHLRSYPAAGCLRLLLATLLPLADTLVLADRHFG
jgi:hypothetical protein